MCAPFDEDNDVCGRAASGSPALGSLEDRVDYATSELMHATRSDDIWWHISNAMESLARASSKSQTRLPPDRRNKLIRTIITAKDVALLVASGQERRMVADGFDALVVIVVTLNEGDAARAARHPDLLRDARNYARILQNHAHNVCLHEQIEGRARRRRDLQVDRIIREALGAAA